MYNRRDRAHAAQLREQCESQLEGIRISHPSAVGEVCEQLAAKRGRPIDLHPLPELGGNHAPCGVIVSLETRDYVFYVTATSERHREQIIRHELAHLLLGHSNGDQLLAEILSIMPEGIDPSAVVEMLGRTSYDSDKEHDAELAAYFLGEIFEEIAAAESAPGREGTIARLDGILAHPRRGR